ncbi:MAG: CDC27 family protein [Myxococcota bacterium]|nr:CDC27 family protein [Myxococcota bacterium]
MPRFHECRFILAVGLMGLLGFDSAHAQPKLRDQLGPERPMPPAGERHAFQVNQTAATQINQDNLLKNPANLVRFFRENPTRLSVDSMNPALALTISRILVEGGALFISEKLLDMSIQKWTMRNDLKREHGRLLVQLGRPNAAVLKLRKLVEDEPNNAANHFIYAFALVRLKPETDARKNEAIKHFEKVLFLDPNYRDSSGWSASNIRNQLNRMKGSDPTGLVP